MLVQMYVTDISPTRSFISQCSFIILTASYRCEPILPARRRSHCHPGHVDLRLADLQANPGAEQCIYIASWCATLRRCVVFPTDNTQNCTHPQSTRQEACISCRNVMLLRQLLAQTHAQSTRRPQHAPYGIYSAFCECHPRVLQTQS